MTMLKLGSLAPNFVLPNQHGEMVELKSFRGKNKVVVYFYPKASTPGCTVQACAIRDYASEFSALNTLILGISPDLPTKLQKFDDKYNLHFNLLSDVEHQVAESYGVWALKKFMGREFMGVVRSSFIIDEAGCLLKIMEKVNTKTHHSQLIDYIKTRG